MKSSLVEAQTQQVAIQNEIRNTTKELSEQKSAVQTFGEGLGKFGEGTEKVGQSLRAVSTTAAGALTVSYTHLYGKLLETAARTFRDTNGRKFKFKVNSLKAGDEEFAKDFSEIISKNIKAYMENEYATYVEYEGEELTEESSNKPQKSSEDFISIRKDIFEVVGQAFKIPASMMLGSVTNVKDVLDIFLTFADVYKRQVKRVSEH